MSGLEDGCSLTNRLAYILDANMTKASATVHTSQQWLPNLATRPNITIANAQDVVAAAKQDAMPLVAPRLKGLLVARRKTLNVVEVFAGAGGLGLGFLTAQGTEANYRIAFSGEVNPIYVQTLTSNHHYFVQSICPNATERVPMDIVPTDLASESGLRQVQQVTGLHRDVDILTGGPPCQGFSNSNRQSWSKDNPNNKLVEAFLDYVHTLDPRVVLLENVQGILWTPSHKQEEMSAARYISKELSKSYLLFPKLLDAVWYGVPQYRTRFFLLGIRRDLGYNVEDFGEWGPFPLPTHGPTTQRPYVTVGEALEGLPAIRNGADVDEMDYTLTDEMLAQNEYLRRMVGTSPQRVFDHVTSKHEEYVIERYKQIPQGGNWQSIRHLMGNYAKIERTHSNIYKRLRSDQPSITMGHYRKSMLVHPHQDRGLSLREACRLQSFPDWFRFAGTTDGSKGGLMHKQQQLANAVCPLVAEAIAGFLLGL